MSIFGAIAGLFNSRDKPQNKAGGAYLFPFGMTMSGKNVNEKTAMQTTAVYACVKVLSEAIASLPIHIFGWNDDGEKERDPKHPLNRLISGEPNSEMTAFVFIETLMSHLLLWGNAYAQIIRNGAGEPIALYPLLPNKMDVSRNDSGSIIYTYRLEQGENRNYPKGGKIPLTSDYILHIPALGFDGLIGYSPIAMAKNAVGMAIATEEYGASFFANGASPGGTLNHPGTIKDINKLKESWNGSYQGSSKAHKVAILEEGLEFKPIGIPPEQAQFLETRKFQISEIARIFRIPPHMIGDLEKSSFSNIEQQSLEFVKFTLNPWVSRWEQALKKALLLPSEKQKNMFIKFNVNGLLRGDYATRMTGYAQARQNGWMSANDIRELEDMKRIPAEQGGDLYLVNGSMTKLEDAGAFAIKGEGG